MNATLGLEVYADRCSGCGFHIATQGCACPGNALKFDGMARATSSAAPDDRSRVDAAIRKVARQGEVFSANDVRPLIEGVPGPLVGARFNAAAKAGVIVRVGYEPSTQARTHAHPIAQWRAA